MTDFITADLHIGHKNILSYCPDTRQYDSVDAMNSALLSEWNSIVTPDDTVYIVGDVLMGSVNNGIGVLSQLNGRKVLIVGNHDRGNLSNPTFVDCFEAIHDYLEIKVNKHKVVLFHYPIFEWNGMHYGSVMLHGHVHQNKTGMEEYRIRNVGIDATGKVVSILTDVVADAIQGRIRIRCE